MKKKCLINRILAACIQRKGDCIWKSLLGNFKSYNHLKRGKTKYLLWKQWFIQVEYNQMSLSHRVLLRKPETSNLCLLPLHYYMLSLIIKSHLFEYPYSCMFKTVMQCVWILTEHGKALQPFNSGGETYILKMLTSVCKAHIVNLRLILPHTLMLSKRQGFLIENCELDTYPVSSVRASYSVCIHPPTLPKSIPVPCLPNFMSLL